MLPIQQVLILKLVVRARNLFWLLEKRAPDAIQVDPPFLLLLIKEDQKKEVLHAGLMDSKHKGNINRFGYLYRLIE